MGSAAAQGGAQLSVAETCFEHHKFGAQPVDVAKSADGETVLAQTSWNWHDAIGCYLTLDDNALAALRAAPAPQSLPDAATEASQRCFVHHSFGEKPVDVAKSADRQTVLARLSWGYHDAIGCYLTLDDTALSTLRAAAASPTTHPEPSPDAFTAIAAARDSVCGLRADGTIACWSHSRAELTIPDGRFTAIATGGEWACATRADQTIACWSHRLDGSYNAFDTPGQYITIVDAGAFGCGLRTDQTIACWGDPSYLPEVPDGQFTAIAGDGDALTGDGGAGGLVCGLRTDQTIACWGDYNNLDTAPDGRFTAIDVTNSARAVFDWRACGLRADQTIACWGGQEGLDTAPDGKFTAIAFSNFYDQCAIRIDQTIACWRGLRHREGFDGLPTPNGQFTAIARSQYGYWCAIRTDQTIACWNYSVEPEHITPSLTVAASTPDGQYTALAGQSQTRMCATKADGTTVCWSIHPVYASPHVGPFGAPDEEFAASATSFLGAISCGLKADGTIACWLPGEFRTDDFNLPAGVTVIWGN